MRSSGALCLTSSTLIEVDPSPSMSGSLLSPSSALKHWMPKQNVRIPLPLLLFLLLVFIFLSLRIGSITSSEWVIALSSALNCQTPKQNVCTLSFFVSFSPSPVGTQALHVEVDASASFFPLLFHLPPSRFYPNPQSLYEEAIARVMAAKARCTYLYLVPLLPRSYSSHLLTTTFSFPS